MTQKQNILSSLKLLDDIVEAYHNRFGSFNFHYSKFELYPWDTGLPKDVYDKMDIDDWAVQIIWSDNSFSIDTYWADLNTILDWYDGQKVLS
jgi:hypothetical protein